MYQKTHRRSVIEKCSKPIFSLLHMPLVGDDFDEQSHLHW